MKLKMSSNSLFAVLLRSPWWVSIAIAAGLYAVAALWLPVQLPRFYALFVALPFTVIGVYTAWKQLRAPSAARVVGTLEALRAMSWDEFSGALEDAFRRDGYAVSRPGGAQADFELSKAGRVSLVGCKRWKVARTGIEPLRELDAARRAREAHECIYITAGEVTDNARAFAAEAKIRILHGAELVKLLPRVGRGLPRVRSKRKSSTTAS
jgi:restriction system protein